MATPTEPQSKRKLGEWVKQLLDGPEDPPLPTRPIPTASEALRAFGMIAVVAVGLNLTALVIGRATGASMTADIGVAVASIGPGAIIAATTFVMALGVLLWTVVGYHVSAFAYLWVPLGWGLALVSLAGVLGASDLGTGLTLSSMHMITAAVTTLWLPRLLPR
jgi:hypothetical protein